MPLPLILPDLRYEELPVDENKYRVLYDNGEGVFFYYGPNGGEYQVSIDEAAELTPRDVVATVTMLMIEDTNGVVIERVGVVTDEKPGPVPVLVYDREDADPVHDILDATVSIYTRGGRHDVEENDEHWIKMDRVDFLHLKLLSEKYPGLVTLKPGLRGS